MTNYKTVFFTLGVLQIILGISMIIPLITQFIFDEIDSGFLSAGIVSIIFGVLFFLSNLDHEKKINLPQAFLLTSLSIPILPKNNASPKFAPAENKSPSL